MKKTLTGRILCGLLSVTLLLSGCGRRSSGGGNNSGKTSGADAVVHAASSLEIRQDPVIQAHLENNRNISTERQEHHADTFHLYIENTESMAGFVSDNTTTEFQEGLQSLMDVAYSNFENINAHMLTYSQEYEELEWEEAELDKKLLRKMQTPEFYEGNPMPEISALEDLSWGKKSAFEAKGVTVLVSNFVEPGNDLNALVVGIESYFDEYPNTAACIMAVTSRFKGELHVPYDGGTYPTFMVYNFAGMAPFYMVMVGPETQVRETAQEVAGRLQTKGITPSYSIYTNNANAQVLEEPMHFNLIGDLKTKKAPADVLRSFNTGTLYEDDGGNAYFAASSGRVETLDGENGGGISTSTQISVVSTDYHSPAKYEWDYKLYSYDATQQTWVEEGKNALAQATVEAKIYKGPLEDALDEEPILAAGREEMLVTARLNFSGVSSLTRNQIYRVEVKLFLNRQNTEIRQESGRDELMAYSIVRADYDAALSLMSVGTDNSRIWTARPQVQDQVQQALLRTPNFSELLTSMENLENKYQDSNELVEYLDFVFNVPQETA